MGKPSMLFEVTRTNTILYYRYWAETIAFYRDVLRLSVSYQKDWFIEFHIAGNTYLSVADEQRASINSASGGNHVVVASHRYRPGAQQFEGTRYFRDRS